ncbi:MAG TPA: pyruvate carboxylase subunit B [Opitutaceae bacterium]|nr:pyruvate carboxylase subunit B [Opitutaceae bacterium]
MKSAPVVFNNTVLRDGHQSLAATRMATAQMLPACADLDSLGFGALETWGGATIDSCLRFLSENPFERLGALKKAAPKTPQMMLLRGQNLVQYTSFPDDVVEAFVAATAARGLDIFRVFDALNDVRNLRTAIRAVKKAGKHAQGAICYTLSPVHTVVNFLKLAEEIAALGCDSICIKDMAGLIQPEVARALVAGIKERTKLPVVLHSHDTAGLAAASYHAAVQAGVDWLDTSIAPFANGTGQPDTLRMLAVLEGLDRCPTYDRAKLVALGKHFEKIYADLSKFTSAANERTDTATLVYQVPGGMLSNFRNQLKEQKMDGQLDQVLAEIPYVRQCLGWIPLVTPTSQIVGTQAMLNVKFGRWKNIAQPTADVLLGKYGRTPGPVDPDLLAEVEKKTGHKRSEERQADLLPPRMEKLKEELRAKGFPDTDEMAVLHAMFPQELDKFLRPPPAPTATIAPAITAPATASTAPTTPASRGTTRYSLSLAGHTYGVSVEDLGDS